MRRPNYHVKVTCDEFILLVDDGPWDRYPTITNTVEIVLEDLDAILHDRKLYYYDSDGVLDQICHKDGKFDGFLPGGPA